MRQLRDTNDLQEGERKIIALIPIPTDKIWFDILANDIAYQVVSNKDSADIVSGITKLYQQNGIDNLDFKIMAVGKTIEGSVYFLCIPDDIKI